MNQRGFTFMNIVAFMASLGLTALYLVVGEPILVGVLTTVGVVQEGSAAWAIILGAPVLIIIGGILILTRPEGYTYGQPDFRWKGPRI